MQNLNSFFPCSKKTTIIAFSYEKKRERESGRDTQIQTQTHTGTHTHTDIQNSMNFQLQIYKQYEFKFICPYQHDLMLGRWMRRLIDVETGNKRATIFII